MITWRIGKTDVEGLNSNGYMIYWVHNIGGVLNCLVWSEKNQAKRVALFKQKRQTK